MATSRERKADRNPLYRGPSSMWQPPIPERVANAKRAFERRFGKSMLPLKVTEFQHDNGARCVRIFDPETGSWAEYNIAWPRVHRMREFDAMSEISSTRAM